VGAAAALAGGTRAVLSFAARTDFAGAAAAPEVARLRVTTGDPEADDPG
jgi:hypothetical protein